MEYLNNLILLKKWIHLFNPVPKNKIPDWCKFKAFADDKIDVTENLKIILWSLENIMGKGENAGYQHFLLSSPCFQMASSTRSLKVVIVW